MPTYEYVCNGCGLRFERQQAMSEKPIAECPECGGKVGRLISGGAGFTLRGIPHKHSDADDCSLEKTGRTCCGLDQRCGKPPCEG